MAKKNNKIMIIVIFMIFTLGCEKNISSKNNQNNKLQLLIVSQINKYWKYKKSNKCEEAYEMESTIFRKKISKDMYVKNCLNTPAKIKDFKVISLRQSNHLDNNTNVVYDAKIKVTYFFKTSFFIKSKVPVKKVNKKKKMEFSTVIVDKWVCYRDKEKIKCAHSGD